MPTKVALVTGGSSGIGEATARALPAAGFTVYAAARRVERMQPLTEVGIRPFAMDVTDDASIQAGVATIIDEQGRIDVLVNNAGYGSYGALEDVPMDEARAQMEVDVFGAARLTQLVLPHMREQRSGTIIDVTSMGGKICTPLGSWYHATKFALEAISDCLRMEVKPFGINVGGPNSGPDASAATIDRPRGAGRACATPRASHRCRRVRQRSETGHSPARPRRREVPSLGKQLRVGFAVTPLRRRRSTTSPSAVRTAVGETPASR